jgi:hypothetical protein
MDGDEIWLMSRGPAPLVCDELGYGHVEMDKHGLPVLESKLTLWMSTLFGSRFFINKKILKIVQYIKIVKYESIESTNKKILMKLEDSDEIIQKYFS